MQGVPNLHFKRPNGVSFAQLAWMNSSLAMQAAITNLMELGGSDNDIREDFEAALRQCRIDHNEEERSE